MKILLTGMAVFVGVWGAYVGMWVMKDPVFIWWWGAGTAVVTRLCIDKAWG